MKFLRESITRVPNDHTIEGFLENLQPGDKMEIELQNFGRFRATVEQIIEDKILFLSDDIMLETCHSFIRSFLYDYFLSSFPESIKKRVINIDIPSCGEVFGNSSYSIFIPDTDKQLELLKDPRNRIGILDGRMARYWLKNKIVGSAMIPWYVIVDTNGECNILSSEKVETAGIRPKFWLKI